MSWHQTQPVLVELVSPAVICFSLMKWYFEPHGTVKGWRGEQGMLCFPPPVSPTHAFFFYLSLFHYICMWWGSTSLRSQPLSLATLIAAPQSKNAAVKNGGKGVCIVFCTAYWAAPPFCQGHPVSSRGFSFPPPKERKKPIMVSYYPLVVRHSNCSSYRSFFFGAGVFNIWGVSLNCGTAVV